MNDEIQLESKTEPPLTAVTAQRLNIRYMMLWTFCCAVYWALIREINARSTTHLDAGLFSSIITGAVFAGMITLISIRFRDGPPLLRHPGHWLLLISAIFTLVGLPILLTVSRSIALMTSHDPGGWQFQVLSVLYVFPPLAFAFAAARVGDRHWKVLFVTMFLLGVPGYLYFLGIDLPSSYFHPWPKILLASAMVILSIVETKTGHIRDWLHWTGVMTHFASCGGDVLSR